MGAWASIDILLDMSEPVSRDERVTEHNTKRPKKHKMGMKIHENPMKIRS